MRKRATKNQVLLGWLAVGALSLAAARVFHVDTIQPLRQRELAARRSVEKLQGRVADARGVVKEVAELKAQLRREQEEIHALVADLPAGSTQVWFPQRMKDHFAGTGGGEIATRLNTALPAADLPGFERTYWCVELPVGKNLEETREVCLAVAALEPRDPAIRVLDTAIRPDADNPSRLVMVLNLSFLAPNR